MAKESIRFAGMKMVDGMPAVFTFGWARNARGQVEQVYSVVQRQRTISQVWTGKTYRNEREAAADSWRLNSRAVCPAQGRLRIGVRPAW